MCSSTWSSFSSLAASSSDFLSRTILVTSFTKTFVSGRTIATVTTLNMVWNMESCICGACGNILPNRYPKSIPNALIISPTITNTTTPLTLNIKCIIAVRLAFFVLASPAKSAVTHEPIFEPIVMYIP